MGDYIENVSTGMDTYSIRQPLGVIIFAPTTAMSSVKQCPCAALVIRSKRYTGHMQRMCAKQCPCVVHSLLISEATLAACEKC